MDGRYGEIAEFWIDGPWVKKNEDWEFARLYNTVKTLQPTCQFGVNTTMGLLPNQTQGGEEILFFPSDFRLSDPNFTRPGANADPKIYTYNGKEYYLPFEATICINNSWFWTSGQNATSVKSASEIKKAYNHIVEQNNTLVVNLSPDTNGLLNDFDVNGLYAGAKALEIARGEARMDIQPGECAVEVRYVTDKGYVAYPSHFVYGKEDETYSVSPRDLGIDGYKLISTPANTAGKFQKEKIVVEFIYEDTGESVLSGMENTTVPFQNHAFVDKKKIVLECDDASNITIYDIAGIKVKELSINQKGIEIVDARNFQGFYIVKFLSQNGTTHSVKIQVR
jgi:hypothetical protein